MRTYSRLIISSKQKVVHKGIVYYACGVETGMGTHFQLLSCNYHPVTWLTDEAKRVILNSLQTENK